METFPRSSQSTQQNLTQNVQSMRELPARDEGMDVIILSTNCQKEAQFWQERLTAVRGQVVKKNALVLSVYEDWPQGAGNGLGTLYAYRQACSLAKQRHDIDLRQWHKEGASLAMYHTAGKGTRL